MSYMPNGIKGLLLIIGYNIRVVKINKINANFLNL